MVQSVVGEWCLCLSHYAPPSFVSALFNSSERAGSQHYRHVYVDIQVFGT